MRQQLRSEMIDAVLTDDVARIDALLAAEVDVNAGNERDETAFSFACAYNKLDAAKLPFARGANINAVDASGASPLDWAVCQSSPEFRNWLIFIGGQRHDDSYPPWAWPPAECKSQS